MREIQLRDVVVLLVDSDEGSRSAIREVLFERGCRTFRLGATAAEIGPALGRERIDVLICGTDLPDGDACQLIAAIRHGEVGTDPFVPVIATTWNPTPEKVRKIVDSGADDLVVKPISGGQLLERVGSLVYKRKPFVVTSDYIGPDRDATSPPATAAAPVDVPNPLRARVTGEADPLAEQARVDEVIAEINRHQLDRYALEIGSLVNMVLPSLGEGLDSGARDILERLRAIAVRAEHRMADTERAHVADLCTSLSLVADNILTATGALNPRDVKLLKPLSQAVQAGFDASEVTAAAARTISMTVGGHADLDQIRNAMRLEANKRSPGKPRGGRRNKFVLRLLVARVSHLFDDHGGWRQRLRRDFVDGFDRYLVQLLGGGQYGQMNSQAGDILNVLDVDEDAEIWPNIYLEQDHRVFGFSILIDCLRKFEDFDRGRRSFMSIVNTSIMKNARKGKYLERFVLDEGQFMIVFGTMFSDLFAVLGDADEAAALDLTFGPGTWERMERIRGAYREYLVARGNESWLDAESRDYLLREIAPALEPEAAAGISP